MPAAARGDQGVQLHGEEARGAVAAILPAHRQAHGDDGRGATPMPSRSSATSANCASCAPSSAGSSATSTVRSQARRILKRHSQARWRAPPRSARSSSVTAAGSSIPSMSPRSSALTAAFLSRDTGEACRPGDPARWPRSIFSRGNLSA